MRKLYLAVDASDIKTGVALGATEVAVGIPPIYAGLGLKPPAMIIESATRPGEIVAVLTAGELTRENVDSVQDFAPVVNQTVDRLLEIELALAELQEREKNRDPSWKPKHDLRQKD